MAGDIDDRAAHEVAQPDNRWLGSLGFVGAIVALNYALKWLFEDAAVTTQVSVSFGFAVLVLLAMVWRRFAGWSEAGESATGGSSLLWLGLTAALMGPGLVDSWRLLSALENPEYDDYQVTRESESVIALRGVISDGSVGEALTILADPAVHTLWITSPGGLVDPALRLARRIRERNVTVVAKEQCASACVVVLAGSPEAAMMPETQIVFHRPASIIASQGSGAGSGGWDDLVPYLAEFGVTDWPADELEGRDYWLPSLPELVAMGLVDYVYAPRKDRLIRMADYCRAVPEACAEITD
jgi:hypothetical protein